MSRQNETRARAAEDRRRTDSNGRTKAVAAIRGGREAETLEEEADDAAGRNKGSSRMNTEKGIIMW